MRFKVMAVFAALLFSADAMALDATNWSTDLEAAKAEAKKDGKDVFIFFAGTGWSEGTKKIADDIFDKKEFLDTAKKTYVLVLVDFPETVLDEAQSVKNKALAAKYKMGGFPTVLIMKADGSVFACLRGYDTMSVAEYLDCLGECVITKMLFEKEMALADLSAGAERAGHLNAALTAIGAAGLFANGSSYGYDKTIAEIIALDPKNEQHLKSDWECYSTLSPLEVAIKTRDWATAHKLADGLIEKYPKEASLLQRMYGVKAFVYRNSNDPIRCLEYMQKCADADPMSELGQKAAAAVPQLKAQIDNEKQDDK